MVQCDMQAGRDSTGSFNSGRSVSSNRRDSMSPVSSRKSLTGSPFQSRGLLKGSPASSRAMASPSSRGSPGFGAAGMSPGASRAGLARMHDCSMGQLHDAYSVLCRKVRSAWSKTVQLPPDPPPKPPPPSPPSNPLRVLYSLMLFMMLTWCHYAIHA